MRRINSFLALALFFVSCNVAQDKNVESITSGTLKLGVDESYSLLMDTEVFTYSHLNKYASIQAHIPWRHSFLVNTFFANTLGQY